MSSDLPHINFLDALEMRTEPGQFDVATWILPRRDVQLDTTTILAGMRLETPRLVMMRDVNDLVALIDAYHLKAVRTR